MILQPAIAFSNSLRFKTKFSILALMFYIPLIACFVWIVSDQLSSIEQYDAELEGLSTIKKVVSLEQRIARSNESSADDVSPLLSQLGKSINGSNVIKNSNLQLRKLSDSWSKNHDASEDVSLTEVYDNALALRESLSALSGLSRESNAIAFYLAEANVQRLPALIEYLTRIEYLSIAIIENQGFTAQSYTSVVALNKRLGELALQLKKNYEQFNRVAGKSGKNYSNQYQAFSEAIASYQLVIQTELIDPDEIALPLSRAKQLAQQQNDMATALWTLSHKQLGELLNSLKNQRSTSLSLLTFIIVAVTVITTYLVIAIYRSLTSNVEEIQAAASRLENGDFTQSVKVDSQDELGDIGRSFGKMQEKIHQLLLEFKDDVNQLRQSSTNIHQLTDQMEQNLTTQHDNTRNVAQAIAQVSESVTVISQNTQNANTLTEQASTHVRDGQSVISETAMAINDISDEVHTSSTVIGEVASLSESIAQFVTVIRGIADQTNLLALNAAIEAARAGEQGRGFAVVADEVRTLASRTQDSTDEIQRIIEQLQQGANRSVEAMNVGVTKAEHGVDKTKQVAIAFEEVTENVGQIVSATIEISSAVEQQRHMVLGIDENTVNIEKDADQVMQSAKKAASAGENLAQLADSLSAQLSQFTLKS